MILDIILLNKNNEEISNETMLDDFKGKLDFKSDQIICDDLIFNYSFKESKNNNNIRLKINTLKESATSVGAKQIDFLKNRIRNGIHRKDFRIIIIYDEASEYYCTKLSRFISIFERKLRQFIYIITLTAYGNNWIKETFSEEIQKAVAEIESNKNRHIEMALECFTFQDFIDYLFTKRYEVELEEVIHSAKNIANNPENSKEDIIKILNKAKKTSLWDKLFDRYGIEFLEDDIDQIRKIRNDVMHNKEISTEEFESYKKLLRSCNKKLDKAILKVESENYPDTVNIIDIFYSLSETMKSMANLGKSVIESITPAINDLIKITESIKKAINIEGISESYNLFLKNQFVDNSKLIKQSYIKSINPLQKSVISNNTFEKSSINTNIVKGAVPNINYISEDYKEIFKPMVWTSITNVDNKCTSVDNRWISNINNNYYSDIFNSKIPSVAKSAFKQNKLYYDIPIKLSKTIKSLNNKNDALDDESYQDDSES